jgi:cobalt/nickel transport system permease protein
MHIPDGVTSVTLNTVTYAISIAVCVYSVKRLGQGAQEKRTPLLLGIGAVLLLLLQLLPFPVTGVASVHLLGAVLVASILGPWATCLLMAVVLVVQCLIFNHGGLIALGTNVFNLGIIGGMGGYCILINLKRVLSHGPRGFNFGLAVAAWASTVLLALALWVEVTVSGIVEINLLGMLGVQSLVGLGEALVTVGAVSLVIKARPDLVTTYCCSGDKEVCYSHHHHVKTHTHETGKEHDHGHIY